MPFSRNIAKIQNLTANATNRIKYSNSFYPAPNVLPNMKLLYPGRINNLGDYRLELARIAVTHPDIVRSVHDCTQRGDGLTITNFLVDLFNNGLNANSNSNINIVVRSTQLSLDEFKNLVYWLVLQEDINYPRPRKMGVRMPIIRYIEGAISALHPELLSLQEVINRTNNHGRPPAPAFIHPNVTTYLANNIQSIR